MRDDGRGANRGAQQTSEGTASLPWTGGYGQMGGDSRELSPQEALNRPMVLVSGGFNAAGRGSMPKLPIAGGGSSAPRPSALEVIKPMVEQLTGAGASEEPSGKAFPWKWVAIGAAAIAVVYLVKS